MRALVVEKDAEGKTSASVQNIDEVRLPAGEVTVAVARLRAAVALTLRPGPLIVRPHSIQDCRRAASFRAAAVRPAGCARRAQDVSIKI